MSDEKQKVKMSQSSLIDNVLNELVENALDELEDGITWYSDSSNSDDDNQGEVCLPKVVNLTKNPPSEWSGVSRQGFSIPLVDDESVPCDDESEFSI